MISQLSPLRQGALVSFGRSKKNPHACPVSWKSHFYHHGIQTQNFPLLSLLLSKSAKWFWQLENISFHLNTKTWKGQLQAVTMALWPMATSSVRANSHFNWFHVQDTESYVIGWDFLNYYNLWSLCPGYDADHIRVTGACVAIPEDDQCRPPSWVTHLPTTTTLVLIGAGVGSGALGFACVLGGCVF
jgi:hypothetical protein